MKKRRPRRRLPPPNWLRSFEAAARYESFTDAARELNITQAAVSQHVRHLEHFLQQPLFQRFPRCLALTDAGRAYLPAVRDAFERLASSTEELFGQDQQAQLTLKADITFASLWLAPRLKAFSQQYPEIQVRIANAIWVDSVGWDNVDVEIRYGHGRWDGMKVHQLTAERTFPVCAPDLLAQYPGPLSAADLRHETLIRVVDTGGKWRRWFVEAGVALEEEEMEEPFVVDSTLVAYEAAAAGYGWVMGSSSMVAGLLDSGRLVKPFDLQVPVERGFYLVSPHTQRETPAAVAFREWLLESSAAWR